ncbi:hypothetical protein EJB05_40057, partial [Eragrostis curvula]
MLTLANAAFYCMQGISGYLIGYAHRQHRERENEAPRRIRLGRRRHQRWEARLLLLRHGRARRSQLCLATSSCARPSNGTRARKAAGDALADDADEPARGSASTGIREAALLKTSSKILYKRRLGRAAEWRLRELGRKLEAGQTAPSVPVDALTDLLEQVLECLYGQEQLKGPSMISAMQPTLKAITREELLKQEDKDVKVLLAFCFFETLRITAPNALFGDDVLRISTV